MTAKEPRHSEPDEFSADELAEQEAFELPDRQALSIFDVGGLGSGIVSTGQTAPDPTQLAGQPTTDPAQANQPVADASGLGNQLTSDAVGTANAAPQDSYQPSATSSAQS